MAHQGSRITAWLGACLLAGSAAPARADWTVAAFLGSASTRPSSIRLQQPGAGTDLSYRPVVYDDESFVSPVYYGYRFGHTLPFAPRFAVEAEFVHLKAFADTRATATLRGTERDAGVERTEPLNRTIERFSISHGVNFVLINLAYRQPLGSDEGRVAVTARAGAGPTVPHGESTIHGESLDQYELGALGWQVAAGVDVRLAKGLRALAEYKFTRTRQTVSVAGGTAGTLLCTHHVVFGLGYQR